MKDSSTLLQEEIYKKNAIKRRLERSYRGNPEEESKGEFQK